MLHSKIDETKGRYFIYFAEPAEPQQLQPLTLIETDEK
jgi:hypothetical protein